MSFPKGTLGLGTVFGYSTSSATGPFTNIASIVGIKPPGVSWGEAETTTFADTIEQFIVGLAKGKDATLKLLYITTQTATVYPLCGTPLYFQITLPDTHTIQWSGFIKDYQPDTPLKEGITEEVQIKTTSKPIYT